MAAMRNVNNDCALRPSKVTLSAAAPAAWQAASKPSRACSGLDQRFALFGVDPRLSEPIQGLRYDPGEYYKEHVDWLSPKDYTTQDRRATHLDGDGLSQRR